VEAWALGQDNQLDLEIRPPPAGREQAGSGETPAAAAAEVAAGSFGQFAAAADRIRATSSKREKIRLLGGFLGSLDEEDAARAAVYFTGRAFAQGEDRALNLGWAVVKRAVLEVSGAGEAELRAAYRRFADAGEAAGAVLAEKTRPEANPLAGLAEFFDRCAAARGPAAKLDLMSGYFRRLSQAEAKYLVKIITGDLRIGLKEGLV
jgi:DNA ligase-1